MLDLLMLESLGQPLRCGVHTDDLPPPLERVFQRVVSDGWMPRNPCPDEEELARLEVSTIRGDCISPLLQAGDVIFTDPDMGALPGDVVSFALSRRGADAQNSALPSGQQPCKPGDHWCKLMVGYHGIATMLLDRHGSSATATLLSCESPDDVPALHPIRQIRRNGRLLFAPDVHASELGDQAATSPSSSVNQSSSTMGSVLTYSSVTVVIPTGQSYSVLVTGGANANLGASPSGAFRLELDGTIIQGPQGWNSNMANGGFTASFNYTTTLSAGTHTFALQGFNSSGGATFEGSGLTVSLLKR